MSDHLQELKQRKQWLNYVLIRRPDGSCSKPPVNPFSLKNGNTQDPEQWTDYKTASANIGKMATVKQGEAIHTVIISGTGVIMNGGYVGIDLDHVLKDGEIIAPFVEKLLAMFDTYTEISVSGTGLHLFMYADDLLQDLGRKYSVDGDGNLKKDGPFEIEIYAYRTGGRYLTVTENVFYDRPINQGKTEDLLKVYRCYEQERNRDKAPVNSPPVGSSYFDEEDDRTVLDKAFSGKFGDRTRRLYDGDWNGYSSQSNADQALVNDLCYWCNGRVDQIDRIFRTSGLMRKKWDEKRGAKTYGQKTIDNALQNFTPYVPAVKGDKGLTVEDVNKAIDKASVKADKGTIKATETADNKDITGGNTDAGNTLKTAGNGTGNPVDDSKPKAPDIEDIIKPIGNYVDGFIEDCKDPKPRHSTGFLSVDRRLNGGLFNELYVMNAETSTGKSAFAQTIAQNLVKSGMRVLYIALEMSRKEFIARGASAISYELTGDEKQAVSASDILYYHFDRTLVPLMHTGADPFVKIAYSRYAEYVEEYRRRYEKDLYIIERPQITKLKGKASGKAIKEICMQFQKTHQDKQIAVFIDYLQILDGDDQDRKTKTDHNILELKELCTQLNTPVFVLSSIGRAGYKQGADIGNAKESGDIEFTGGIMLGWDWSGVTDYYSKSTDWQDKHKSIKEVKRRDREEYKNRLIMVSLLKNRNSERDCQDGLIYYPKFNYFREVDKKLDKRRLEDSDVKIEDLLTGKVMI